ncbi:MAG: hypothetical protein AAGC44_13405 [Planctomycetota bacterium]
MVTPPKDQGTPSITLDPRGIAELAAELQRRAAAQHRRVVLAIAGVPGSGKSTLAKALAIHLNRAAQAPAADGYAVVLGLDAFHLSNDRLESLGLTERKGIPQSFDAQGYLKLLSRCRDPRHTLDLPVYDRKLHEPVYSGKAEDRVGPGTRVILTEGNYLLLDAIPWNAIDELADLRLWLETPAEKARAWLIRRHISVGRSLEQAVRRVEENDAMNADLVLEKSRHADKLARWPDSSFAG